MRKFMLYHAAGETVELLNHLFQVLIVIFHLDLRRAAYLGIDSRHTEAAFGELTCFLALFKNHRVDHDTLEILEIVICISKFPAVYYDHTEIHSDLRSCKSASVRNLESLPHIGDKLCKTFLIVKVRILVFISEYLRTI